MMGSLNVVNGKVVGWAGNWYIGREGNGLKQSALRNRYAIGKDGNRDEVIQKFRSWLWQHKDDPDVKQELEAIIEQLRSGQDVNLACYCKPLACHGDVVKSCIEWMMR